MAGNPMRRSMPRSSAHFSRFCVLKSSLNECGHGARSGAPHSSRAIARGFRILRSRKNRRRGVGRRKSRAGSLVPYAYTSPEGDAGWSLFGRSRQSVMERGALTRPREFSHQEKLLSIAKSRFYWIVSPCGFHGISVARPSSISRTLSCSSALRRSRSSGLP